MSKNIDFNNFNYEEFKSEKTFGDDDENSNLNGFNGSSGKDVE